MQSMEVEERPYAPPPHKRLGGPLRSFASGDLFTMILGAFCTAVICSVCFGLAVLLGAIEGVSMAAGLVFLLLPCVAVGWLACGPLPCDRDETMRRMKFG